MDFFSNIALAAAEGAPVERLDMFEVLRKSIEQGNWVVLGTLGLLVLFSLVSWYIIGYKWYYVRKAQNESIEFLESFWQSKRLDQIYQNSERLKASPISMVFRAGYSELAKIKK